MTAPVKGAPPKAGGKAAVVTRPFRVGVHKVEDQPYDVTVTTTASTQTLNPIYEIPSTGYLNGVNLLVEATTAANAAAVTFAANGPFNVIDTITFSDTNNQPIIGPIDGYDLYLINKWGGYAFQDDPKSSPIFSATTGGGATGGSFVFCLRIPVELVPRDGLGTLPNKSSSTPFKVKISVSATATIYGVAPTAAPSVRFRMTPDSYGQPITADSAGNPIAQQPPGVDTTQFWNKTSYTVASGAISPQLTSSVGFPARNLMFVLKDSVGSRAQGETDFPDPFRLQLDANIILDRLKKIWQTELARDYGYTGAVGDAANGKDNGLYVRPFCKDFGPKPGWETRRDYLALPSSVRLQALGTVAGAGLHTLEVYTNYVAPGAGSTLASITA